MNDLTREHTELNPDLQRPLYRGTGGIHRTKQPSLIERMKELQAAFPDYAEREIKYQEYLKTKSEYR